MTKETLSEKIKKVCLLDGSWCDMCEPEDVAEAVKKLKDGKRELKQRNQNQRGWVSSWETLSKQGLLNKLSETLDSFDKDIDELLDFNKIMGKFGTIKTQPNHSPQKDVRNAEAEDTLKKEEHVGMGMVKHLKKGCGKDYYDDAQRICGKDGLCPACSGDKFDNPGYPGRVERMFRR